MAATQKQEAPQSLTLEKVREYFYANVEENAKRQAEAAKRQAEWEQRQAEAEREAVRRQADWERRQADWERRWEKIEMRAEATDLSIGKLGNAFGSVVEHLVSSGIEKRFVELGLSLKVTATDLPYVEDRRIVAEADILLENDEIIVVVEVKAKPNDEDVREHEERLAILRDWYDRRNDRRRILGAIAGAVFSESAMKFALRSGFYVAKQSGDTMEMVIPKGFKPREW